MNMQMIRPFEDPVRALLPTSTAHFSVNSRLRHIGIWHMTRSDLLIRLPPYVCSSNFQRLVERSVRRVVLRSPNKRADDHYQRSKAKPSQPYHVYALGDTCVLLVLAIIVVGGQVDKAQSRSRSVVACIRLQASIRSVAIEAVEVAAAEQNGAVPGAGVLLQGMDDPTRLTFKVAGQKLNTNSDHVAEPGGRTCSLKQTATTLLRRRLVRDSGRLAVSRWAQEFCAPALDILWRDVDHLTPLFKILTCLEDRVADPIVAQILGFRGKEYSSKLILHRRLSIVTILVDEVTTRVPGLRVVALLSRISSIRVMPKHPSNSMLLTINLMGVTKTHFDVSLDKIGVCFESLASTSSISPLQPFRPFLDVQNLCFVELAIDPDAGMAAWSDRTLVALTSAWQKLFSLDVQ
ncbi:hypothetical protein DAEQUDRAFT_790119 [Daedalea quercina L-15889]|uniref:Uncharacterized protein n=1 Tax=Daedalea quercina L-15889 TaxID=1314783 RepID=A0A165PIA8_9APHY|nr:hypothetical protein DAEQUDRAFT_790119 [Daedalea quercina L-15889]